MIVEQKPIFGKMMNYRDFFIENNKAGHKTREKWLKTHFNDLYEQIIQFSHQNLSLAQLPFKQKIWYFINDVMNIPTCKECGKELKFGRSIKEGYPIYCSITCANRNDAHIDNVKDAHSRKYGVTCSLQIPAIKEATEKLMIKTYGLRTILN